MDCGPTCLRMVAAYHGKRYSLERLREKSFLTREGVSLLGISEAAEKIGLRSMCVQIGYDLLTEAPLPCIVHWNQQHFVVVYKLDKQRVWVADPGAGKLKYTKEEFCRCWLSSRKEGEDRGVALLLEPTPEFYAADEDEEENTAFKGFPFLFTYLRPYKQLVGQLLLGLLLGSLIQLLLPFLTQSVVDFGINNQNLGFIYLALIAQLMLTFSSAAVEFIRGWILLHLGTRINISLIADFLSKLMRLPMGYFDTKTYAHTGLPDGQQPERGVLGVQHRGVRTGVAALQRMGVPDLHGRQRALCGLCVAVHEETRGAGPQALRAAERQPEQHGAAGERNAGNQAGRL